MSEEKDLVMFYSSKGRDDSKSNILNESAGLFLLWNRICEIYGLERACDMFRMVSNGETYIPHPLPLSEDGCIYCCRHKTVIKDEFAVVIQFPEYETRIYSTCKKCIKAMLDIVY